MPTPDLVLAGLARIANNAFGIAIGWHLAVLVALLVVSTGWRPSRRVAAAAIVLPILSAAILAGVAHNPFNAFLLGAISLALLILVSGLRTDPVVAGSYWFLVAGAAMIAFAWVYPHFLAGSHLRYLWAAPMGVIPCPSLALAIGFALLAGGIGRAFSLVLAGAGLFYALVGSLWLGVRMDLFLLAGSLLLALSLPRAAEPHTARRARSSGR